MPSQLAQRIRSRYPGSYDDMSDEDLESAILSKYPGVYDDLVETPSTTTTSQNRGLLGGLTEPLWEGPLRATQAIGNRLVENADQLPEFIQPAARKYAGINAAALNFLGGMASPSPLDIGLMATTGGAGLAAKAGMPAAVRGLNTATRIGSGAVGLQGAHRIGTAEGMGDVGLGAMEMLGGATGGFGRLPSAGNIGRVADDIITSPSPVVPQSPVVPPRAAPPVSPVTTPIAPQVTGAVAEAVVDEPPPLIARLLDSLKKNKPLEAEQARLTTAERAEKFATAGEIPVMSTEDLPAFYGAFKGKHTKITREPLGLNQDDVNELLRTITRSDELGAEQKLRAYQGLMKLDEGGVLQPSERELLGVIFGPQVKNALPPDGKGRRIFQESFALAKGLKAAGDPWGFMFRQGINHVGQKEWNELWVPMTKAYFSEDFYQKNIAMLRAGRNAKFKDKVGLAHTDLRTFSGREETIMSTWAEQVPGLGRFVRAGNRAYTLGANKLRDSLFDTLYDDYNRMYDSAKKMARSADELKAAELLNPHSNFTGKKIADLVNTSTGRGSLGKFERVADDLNSVFFAPRLVSARMRTFNRVFNPYSYAKIDPIERKYALKQLISLTGTAITAASMFKLAGADIEMSPNSTDFLKGRFGNTRIDLMGGYQQYIPVVAKVLMNEGVSTRTGEPYELGQGMSDDAVDVWTRFITNKAAPLTSLALTLMRRSDPVGKPVDLTNLNPLENTVMKTFIPMLIEDMYDLWKDDKGILPVMAGTGFASIGAGVQVHEPRPVKSPYDFNPEDFGFNPNESFEFTQ